MRVTITVDGRCYTFVGETIYVDGDTSNPGPITSTPSFQHNLPDMPPYDVLPQEDEYIKVPDVPGLGLQADELTTVFDMMELECDRQEQLWGDQSYKPHPDMLAVLTEEVGEVARAINEHDEDELYEELIQVGAVAATWASYLLRPDCDGCEDCVCAHTPMPNL